MHGRYSLRNSMWVIFNKYDLTVIKTCQTKDEAQGLLSNYKKRNGWVASRLQIEEFKTGNLDAWVTWKHLTKGTHEY